MSILIDAKGQKQIQLFGSTRVTLYRPERVQTVLLIITISTMMGVWITPVFFFWRISLTETFARSFGLVIWVILFFTALLSVD